MNLPTELIKISAGLYGSADDEEHVYFIPSEFLSDIEIIETPQTVEVAVNMHKNIYDNSNIEVVVITQEALEESQITEEETE